MSEAETAGAAEVVGRALAVICVGIERAIPSTIWEGGGGDKLDEIEAASFGQGMKKAATWAASSGINRDDTQMLFISTLRSLSNSSSISACEMISGGDSAMMSPVVRIRSPSL